MKRILFFLNLLVLPFCLNAQAEWTGGGDGQSWDDPNNWLDSYEPQNGDDILIDGGAPNYFYSDNTYGSLELTNGTNLLIVGDLNLNGDLTVDPTSVISIDLTSLTNFGKIILGGNYFFNGETDLLFSTYVPQINSSFLVVQGSFGSCGTPTTDLVPESQTSGFEVSLGVQCQAAGVLLTVTDINYTTAKSWDGEGTDNFWYTAANWDPNGVPTANDNVVINLPSGGVVNTNGAGVTSANIIMVGDGNTLIVNGDLSMLSVVHVNDTGEIIWNGGEISKRDPNVTSAIINYGEININGGGLKEMDGNFEIWNFNTINHNAGNLNINNGIVDNYFPSTYNINSDNINIGYTSGTNHSFRNFSTVRKTTGTGVSSINLSNFTNSGSIISQMGTIAFGEDLNSDFGDLRGEGGFDFPNSYVYEGNISPGSSPGILNMVNNFTTGENATFIIEIDGTNAGSEHDQIVVTNNATLDGDIEVVLGYLPANDASFQILTAGNLVSCDFPTQINTSFGGTPYTFDVVCQNNILYLNGPGATLSTANSKLSNISVYPNPVKSVLNIELASTKRRGLWRIINQIGQVVKLGDFKTDSFKISLENLQNGLYIFEIKDTMSNEIVYEKILIDK